MPFVLVEPRIIPDREGDETSTHDKQFYLIKKVNASTRSSVLIRTRHLLASIGVKVIENSCLYCGALVCSVTKSSALA